MITLEESQRQTQTPSVSEAQYHVRAWGEGFFGVNDAGHVVVHPGLDNGVEIDLYKVVEELDSRGVGFPVTLRFPDVIRKRVGQLNSAFFAAMEETDYAGGYVCVYPVKVNQIRQVLEGVLGNDGAGFGLECGSKAELIATLPYAASGIQKIFICNGYKNAEMISLMLGFQRLGKNVVPIIENEDEFDAITTEASKFDSVPRMGMRVRLSATGAGQWSESSGDNSKFGISMPDLLTLVQRLEDADHFSSLSLLHFHLGSQIDDIQALKMAVREIARIYVGLHRRGHQISYLDVGGGLGVNYDAAPLGGGKGGVNYSIQEYANVIVYAVKEVCDAEKVPVPTLVTENGRAIVAHHALLVAEAVGSTSKPTTKLDAEPSEDQHQVLHLLYEMAVEVKPENGKTFSAGRLLETFHDAIEERRNAHTLFAYGYLKLNEQALAERLYWTICTGINERIQAAKPDRIPAELKELDAHLVDQVLCDFSVFQSLTDHWSIGQRFPIMPIHRLDEAPSRRCRLVDLTCDSYGTISEFVSPGEPTSYLNLHPILGEERYFLGIFLTGAYQDSLSDHHNLFGVVTEAHVVADETQPNGFAIREILSGAPVSSMLRRVHYDPEALADTVDTIVQKEVAQGRVTKEDGKQTMANYRSMIDASTYLEARL